MLWYWNKGDWNVIIKDVEITQFRNIINEKIELSENLTVICGQNGQGKTNLLESIWLLTGAKSFRGAKDAQLITHNYNFAKINSNIKNELSKNIIISVFQNENLKVSRKAFINDVEYKRASLIAGNVMCIVFEPNHLKLIKSGPLERRTFIDTALCQLYPAYITLLRTYARITAQKNALLKNFYKSEQSNSLLDVYNENLASTGEKISLKRQNYIKTIKSDVINIYDDISSKKENLSIIYNACFYENETPLIKTLNENKQKEINAGFCLYGPHREDFTININDKEAKLYASQGQQRSAVLSLKLAEANAVLKIAEEKPIMLFDDVLSELDDARQNYILNNIKDKQTVLTSCDISLFNKTNGKIFVVENGKIKN